MKYISKLVVVIGAVSLLGVGCDKAADTINQSVDQSRQMEQRQESNQSSSVSEETLQLENLGGITFADYQPGAETAGDFLMSKYHLDVESGRIVPMYLFGQALPGRDHVQLNPNLEFGGLQKAIDVIASIDGVIGFVRQQSGDDYEVFLQPRESSIWTIGYDHLSGVTVKQGDRVKVGQVLGQAVLENNGTYRYELQINKDLNGVTTFYCPTDLLNPTIQAGAEEAIKGFITDWNSFYASTAYGSHTEGCAKSVLTLEETE